MIYLHKRRDMLEVIRDILEGVSKGLTPTRIMMYSNSNYIYVKKIISNLYEEGLIKISRNPKESRSYIQLTPRGLYLHKLLIDFQYYLYSNGGEFVEENAIDGKLLEEKALPTVNEILSKKRRGRIEIYFVILVSVMNTARSLSSIANMCFLNTEQAKKYIEELVDLNMLKEVDSDVKKKYFITHRGLQFVYLYLKIHELIYGLNYDN